MTQEVDDLSMLIAGCTIEFRRIGESWRSSRTLDFCEKATGKRDGYYLTGKQLEQLLSKLKFLPTTAIRPGAKVRQGTVQEWDADIDCWIVQTDSGLEPFDTEELELVS